MLLLDVARHDVHVARRHVAPGATLLLRHRLGLLHRLQDDDVVIEEVLLGCDSIMLLLLLLLLLLMLLLLMMLLLRLLSPVLTPSGRRQDRPESRGSRILLLRRTDILRAPFLNHVLDGLLWLFISWNWKFLGLVERGSADGVTARYHREAVVCSLSALLGFDAVRQLQVMPHPVLHRGRVHAEGAPVEDGRVLGVIPELVVEFLGRPGFLKVNKLVKVNKL